jgi:hypothetical protein
MWTTTFRRILSPPLLQEKQRSKESEAKNNGAGSVAPTRDSMIDHPFEHFTRFTKPNGFIEKVNF